MEHPLFSSHAPLNPFSIPWQEDFGEDQYISRPAWSGPATLDSLRANQMTDAQYAATPEYKQRMMELNLQRQAQRLSELPPTPQNLAMLKNLMDMYGGMRKQNFERDEQEYWQSRGPAGEIPAYAQKYVQGDQNAYKEINQLVSEIGKQIAASSARIPNLRIALSKAKSSGSIDMTQFGDLAGLFGNKTASPEDIEEVLKLEGEKPRKLGQLINDLKSGRITVQDAWALYSEIVSQIGGQSPPATNATVQNPVTEQGNKITNTGGEDWTQTYLKGQ